MTTPMFGMRFVSCSNARRILKAENGKEAIEKAPELDPDLIVLDLSMPVTWMQRVC
jgi:YesN/AraC family two-component response regulator